MAPSLSQVVASGGTAASLNLYYLLALMMAAGAAVFSVVKGLEVYRRGRLLSVVVDDTPSLMEIENRKKMEKLSFMVDELKREKELLSCQNVQLQGQASTTSVQKQMEEILRKSNEALAKQCQRLKSEKEELVLRSAKPLIKTKTTKKAKVNKKEVARKPRRVSKKNDEN